MRSARNAGTPSWHWSGWMLWQLIRLAADLMPNFSERRRPVAAIMQLFASTQSAEQILLRDRILQELLPGETTPEHELRLLNFKQREAHTTRLQDKLRNRKSSSD